MKILIANPPAYIEDHDRHFVQAGSRWSFSMYVLKESHDKYHYLPYPFFLGYSSALLKRDLDANVKAIDACALDFDEKKFLAYAKGYDPDVLVTEIPTISFPLMMKVLREVKNLVDCRIIVAGNHVTALTQKVMGKYAFIDYCLVGEYEIVLKELLSKLTLDKSSPEETKKINGIAFRHDDKVIVNKNRNILEDLDSLSFPDMDDLPVKYYHDFEIAGKPSVNMLSSRGCPFSCSFCLQRHVMYASPTCRKRNPTKIVDEMEFRKEKYGAKQIYFDDDTMTVDKRHLRSMSQEIIRRRVDILWGCMGDVTLDYETLSLMSKAGCVGVKFGVESINPNALKSINKNFIKAEKVRRFVKWCKELRIWTHATYIIGLPGIIKKGD